MLKVNTINPSVGTEQSTGTSPVKKVRQRERVRDRKWSQQIFGIVLQKKPTFRVGRRNRREA